jgi:DNA polymerase elongation subunit (family B)
MGSTYAGLRFQPPSDVPAVRDRLHAGGIDTFEADVRFAVRY